MILDHHKLARLQLYGMLGLVFGLVFILASYFFYQHWNDYQRETRTFNQDTRLRGQAFLKAYGEHASHTLENLYSQTQDILRKQLKEQVDQAYAISLALYQRNEGKMSDAQIGREIAEALRPVRYFNGRGYFFIDTLDGRCVLLPTNPSLEGKSLLDNRDDTGTPIMRKLLLSVDNASGAGFARYRWYRPNETAMSEKIAYSRRFKPLDWLIGSGEYVLNIEDDLKQQGLRMLGDMPVGQRGFFSVMTKDSKPESLNHKYSVKLPAHVLAMQARQNSDTLIHFDIKQGNSTEQYTAYISEVPSWQWRILTIIPTAELSASNKNGNQHIYEQTRDRMLTTLGILLLAVALAWLFSVYITRWLGDLIGKYRQQLQNTERQLHEKAHETELIRYMSDSATDIILLLDQQQQLVYHNETARRYLYHADPQRTAHILAAANGHKHYLYTDEQSQQPCTLDIQLSDVLHEGKIYLCITARDITARTADERQLRLAATVFEASSEAILITDVDSRIIAVNRAFSDITGYQPAEALGQTPALLNSGQHDADFYRDMWHHLNARGCWTGEIWNRRKNGEIYPEWLTINEVRSKDGQISHFVALFSDISERKATEAQMQHLAEYDFLTNLPNRLLLNDRLLQALRIAERKHHQVAVLFMDLDRFKNVNDTLGHDAGDQLLCEVALRTKDTLREMDTVGRTGGDEFVIILPELDGMTQAALVAERILYALSKPFDIQGHTIVTSASIGIAISPNDGKSPDILLKNADMAMYGAKADGRNTFRFFTPSMTAEVSERLLLENKLRQTIANNGFHLALQPKYHIASRTLSGFEALLRWRDDKGEDIPPSRFIPVAEDSGLIMALGRWVLIEACKVAACWVATGQRELTMAVNVSARQLTHGPFSLDLAQILHDTGLPPQLLEIEVTEGTLIDYSGPVREQLQTIKDMGVRLAVDDFGTGYSSLAYLKNFAPDTLKIDRSFVTELQHKSDNAAIVSTIITLARNLHMEALAEGVETEEELAALQDMGCDTVQGYLTGRPMSVKDALALVAQQSGKH